MVGDPSTIPFESTDRRVHPPLVSLMELLPKVCVNEANACPLQRLMKLLTDGWNVAPPLLRGSYGRSCFHQLPRIINRRLLLNWVSTREPKICSTRVPARSTALNDGYGLENANVCGSRS